MIDKEILDFYDKAKREIINRGFYWEIESVKDLRLEDITAHEFFEAYSWVVISSGMKNQVAEQIFQKFLSSGYNPEIIGHPGKRYAIQKAKECHINWFTTLLWAENKIDFLGSLPWIGPITKYHLARNLGMDCAKPDRHLVRLSARFGFNDVKEMCKIISKATGDRIGVVDVVLWRYCNLNGSTEVRP